MSDKPPTKARVLTRLRIDEVSAVDKGAGKGVKVVLMKRDQDDATHPEMPEWERRYWQALGATALRQAEERYAKQNAVEPEPDEDEDKPFLKYFLRKSPRGDEAEDLIDEPKQHVGDGDGDGDGGSVNDHHASKVADLLVESGKHPDRQSALDHLLHTAHGAAILQRLSKQNHEDLNPMSFEQKIRDIAKREGVVVIAKIMVADNRSYGISESELVDLISNHERKPDESPAQCFARHYEANNEDGLSLRKAVAIAKNMPFEDDSEAEAEKDSRAPIDELAEIGKRRWPGLTRSQQFARAFETNPALAKRAHRRPGPSTSFAHPVTKMPEQASLEPRVADAQNVDDPNEALAQLRQIGRDKWPSESEAESFLRAMTDPENADLIRRALAAPTGSTPPRRQQY